MDAPAKIGSISVLIPDGGNYDTLKVLRCLGRVPEVKAHILSRAKRPMDRFSRYCAGCHYHTSQNDEEWIDVITDVVRKRDIDVVLPATSRGIELISRYREAISNVVAVPPLASTAQIRMSNNKWTFYRLLREQGLPGAPTIFIGKTGETIAERSAIDSIEYPALLKPTSQMNGYGIVKVNSPSGFYHVWNDKDAIIDGEQYILQSFIPGDNYSLSVCCQRGELTAYSLYRVILPSKSQFGTGRLVEYVNDKKVLDVGRKLVSAMEWDGVANIDLVVDERDQTVKILEFNPRFWRSLLGGMIAGVNFPLIWCLNALGVSRPSRQREGARYASPSQFAETLISRLIGRHTQEKIGLKESGLRFTVGDPIPELVNAFRGIVKRLRQHRSAER